MNPQVFAAHIASLCDEHQINHVQDTVAHVDESHAQDIRIFGTIVIKVIHVPPITDEKTYSTALHELGHLIAPDGNLPDLPDDVGMLRQVEHRLRQEDIAWAWARNNALVWTAAMEVDAQIARETYRVTVVDAFRARYVKGRPLDEWS